MRALSEKFLDDLENPDKLLHPILKRVKQDDTLMLAIRDNYINIYYRGGNLLKLTEQDKSFYQAFFDEKYNILGRILPALPGDIACRDEADAWVKAVPVLKETMDFYFKAHPKPEREFQQLVARENNCSSISNESEYFVSDIEFADSGLRARFDMLAIRWLADQRKDGCNCRASFIEMKYGDGALDGNAGLLKHLQDIESFISDDRGYKSLLNTMEMQFSQLDQLELLKFNRCSNGTKVQLNTADKPEVVFLLANHNPRSTKLKTVLDNPEIDKYAHSELFELKFFVAAFAGYGMHTGCMNSLTGFRNLL